MFGKTTIHLTEPLAERAKVAAAQAGYSSLEEFVRHLIEQELNRTERARDAAEVTRQLKGLGYLE